MGKKTQKGSRKSEIEPIPEEDDALPQLEINCDGIYAHQKKIEIFCENAEHAKNIQLFSKVKYKQNIYQVGEYVHLFDPTDTLPYVAKIHSIIRIPSQEIATILKVQWLLRKSELPQKFEKDMKHFSVAEVFPSGQFEYVLIQSIKRKCYVIQAKQYEYLLNAGDNIHFSRAVYDKKQEEFDPDISEWEKQCYCQTPINPDQAYVQCEMCQHWFHNECVKDPTLIEAQQFICKNCEKKKA